MARMDAYAGNIDGVAVMDSDTKNSSISSGYSWHYYVDHFVRTGTPIHSRLGSFSIYGNNCEEEFEFGYSDIPTGLI